MLIMDLGFVESYNVELGRMNNGKKGRPYKISESYIRFLAIIKYIFSIGFRQLEGFTISLSREDVPNPPQDRLLMD